jgi:LPS export ABC transporter protein LptC
MNKFISIVHQYFFAAALIIGCCFVTACENKQKDIDVWTGRVVMKEEGKNIESFFSQDGKMRAKLTAPLMYRVSDDTLYVEFPNTLHVDFYDSTANVESRLDCKYGKYFENFDKVYLRDSVVVISIKGDTLKCPDLWWDQKAKLFYTDKYSEYHAKDKTINGGKGLEATQDMSTVTFREPTGVVGIANEGVK